jgi:hypothetical protein
MRPFHAWLHPTLKRRLAKKRKLTTTQSHLSAF